MIVTRRCRSRLALILPLSLSIAGCVQFETRPGKPPVAVIFDTDIGNDVDDVLALAMLHTMADAGLCRLLAVTISKDNPWAAPFVDLVNTFYGRPDIPVATVRGGKTPDDGRFLRAVAELGRGGERTFPRDLEPSTETPQAVDLLRETLAAQSDGSVTFVVVGFSTNLARLLESEPDSRSPLAGRELVAKKVRLLSIMAGWYGPERDKEYNVYTDAPAARRVYAEWPTPIVASGYEVGRAIRYPASSIEQDFHAYQHHPLPEAYRRYLAMPYDRECWDLTSVLVAVEGHEGYFDLSARGVISIDDEDLTHHRIDPTGQHRYLTVDSVQAARTRDRLVHWVTAQPALHHTLPRGHVRVSSIPK